MSNYISALSVTSKETVISFDSINSTLKQCRNVKLELLYHHIKFYPDQLKSVQESDPNKLCFLLTLPQSRPMKVL